MLETLLSNRTVSVLWEALPRILSAGLTMTIPLTLISFTLAMVLAVAVALVQYARVHLTEELGGGSLIYPCFRFQSQDAYGFEHTQCADSVRFGSIFGHVERYLHMTLCCQIVDFIRLHLLYDADQ